MQNARRSYVLVLVLDVEMILVEMHKVPRLFPILKRNYK